MTRTINSGIVYHAFLLYEGKIKDEQFGYTDTAPATLVGNLAGGCEQPTLEKLAEVLAKSNTPFDNFSNMEAGCITKILAPSKQIRLKIPLTQDELKQLAIYYSKNIPSDEMSGL